MRFSDVDMLDQLLTRLPAVVIHYEILSTKPKATYYARGQGVHLRDCRRVLPVIEPAAGVRYIQGARDDLDLSRNCRTLADIETGFATNSSRTSNSASMANLTKSIAK